MNLIEKYVTNITSIELKHNDEHDFDYYEVVADTDCYGVKEKQKKLILLPSDYESIKNSGYYLT